MSLERSLVPNVAMCWLRDTSTEIFTVGVLGLAPAIQNTFISATATMMNYVQYVTSNHCRYVKRESSPEITFQWCGLRWAMHTKRIIASLLPKSKVVFGSLLVENQTWTLTKRGKGRVRTSDESACMASGLHSLDKSRACSNVEANEQCS